MTTATLPASAKRQFSAIGGKLRILATWNGGPYIDLHWTRPGYRFAEPCGAPFEVINVWDYRAGRLQVDMTEPDALRRELREWYESLGRTPAEHRAELTNYYRHTA